MDQSHGQQFARPRKRGRPLTYEEKWMVQQVFETLAQEKNAEPSLQRHDPYSLTSNYTGVARSVVAAITKAVRQTGSVPVPPSVSNGHQTTTIPVAAEGRIRAPLFEKHGQGRNCRARHVTALLAETF